MSAMSAFAWMCQSVVKAQSHCRPYNTEPKVCQTRKSCRATMRGATPYWDNKASSMPPTIKIIAACAHGYCATAPFGLDSKSSSNVQATETHVWAANSLAAILPAAAGDGRCANSMGTTSSPTVVKLPHQRAATSRVSGLRIITSPFKGSLRPPLRSGEYRRGPALQRCRPLPCRSTLEQWGSKY